MPYPTHPPYGHFGKDNSKVERLRNYNSHSWHWVRDPGSPHQCPERMRVCRDCGIEDSGHPDEFDIEYPHCNEIGD